MSVAQAFNDVEMVNLSNTQQKKRRCG